jgi:hypothetical protein
MAVLLLSGACSLKQYVPVAGIPNESNYAIVRNDSLLTIIHPQSYVGTYQELNSRFFTVYLRIKNTSSHKLRISPGNFSVLAGGKQFDPIPLDYILQSFNSISQYNPSIDPFFTEDTNPYATQINKDQERYYELIANAFSYGDLLTGGTKEGYLFYSRELNSADSLSVDVLGNNVGFIRK